MKKYLVLSYYDGSLTVESVKDTYDEAYLAMKEDYDNFIESYRDEGEVVSDYYIEKYIAFANPNGDNPCDWCIKEITIPDPKVTVEVKGGVVQNIYCTDPNVEAQVIDFDNAECEGDYVYDCAKNDMKSIAETQHRIW